jgi:hypothetical protein
MKTQRVPPAPAVPIRQVQSQPAPRQQHTLVPPRELTPPQELDDLTNDYQRALFCRRQAEAYRRKWLAGREREMAYLLERVYADDARFRGMTSAELEITARWRWSHSAHGHHFMNLEQKYSEWAHLYLAFAELETLNRHG